MKMLTFSLRNQKEIIRDPLTIIFSLGFPLVLLFLLTAIQKNIPIPLFQIQSITPGITVFGLSFMTLFASLLVAKDRESALLQRLYTTPLTAVDFILGYTLPILPIALAQAVVTYIAALFLGLKFSVNILLALLFIVPISIFFIAMGLLFGSILNVKAVGGVSGALFTNVAAWLSGIWFDLDLVGGAFKTIANALPFSHAVDLSRCVVQGNFIGIFPHIWWILGYSVIALVLAILLFLRQMKKQ